MSDELELQPSDESTIIVKPSSGDAPVPEVPQIAPPRPEPGAPGSEPEVEAEPETPANKSPYKIEEMDVFGILEQALSILKQRWQTLAGITAAIVVPVKVVFAVVLFVLALIPPLRPFVAPPDSTETTMMWAIVLVGVTIYGLIMVGFAYSLVYAAALQAIAGEFLGEPATVSESIDAAMPRLIPVVWTSFLVALLAGFGSLLLVIPGAYLLLRFWFAIPCVMLEKRSGWAALKRSGQLMQDNYGNLAGLIILMFIAATIGHGAASKVEQPVLHWMADTAADVFVGCFSAAATIVFYFSTRCRLEQFDTAALVKEMKGEQAVTVAEPAAE